MSRAAYPRSSGGDREDDEDQRDTSRRAASDEDGSDQSDRSGDEDDQSARGTSGGSSRRGMINNNRRKKGPNEKSKKQEILVDRTVIHEALIRRAIHKDLATFYDAAVVPLENEIDLDQTTRLVLSFCNIYAIDNLAGFDKLTHLQLDNNIIDRIQHLDHLTNLTWLDLSFNNIRHISGLGCLKKLQDLSLTDNEITTIEGLDSLEKLNVLSIGNNLLRDLSVIAPLRKFTNLRALNLKGNPVCTHDDYRNTVCAYLTNLKYLDNTVIEASQFAKARDAKLDQLLVLEAKEKAEEIAERERKAMETQQKLLDSANLAGLSTLFVDMIKADTEHPKIRVLPGFDALQKSYRDAFAVVIEEFSTEILQRHTLKQEEYALASRVLSKIQSNAVKESTKEIDRFHRNKKKIFMAHSAGLDSSNSRGGAGSQSMDHHSLLPNLRIQLNELIEDLMSIEMLLVEQCENVLEEFEKCYIKLLGDNVILINSTFRVLIDTSNKHLSNIYDLTHHLLERFTKDESLTEGDIDVRAILSDKDLLSTAVSTSHENQEAKISLKEDEVREREEGGGKRMIKEMRDAHRARNRKRVAEIYGLKSIEEAAIAAQEAQQDEDDDA